MLKLKIVMRGEIVSVCDTELLGQVYRRGKCVLDLKRYHSFYNGETIDESSARTKEMRTKLTKAHSINAVGKRSIAFLKELGFNTKNAKTIGNVPHLQIYRL